MRAFLFAQILLTFKRSSIEFMIGKSFILLLFLLGSFSVMAQDKNPIPIKKADCNNLNENSPKSKQLRCMLIDVVKDGINYSSMEARKSNIVVDSPEKAWKQLRKLYPDYKKDDYCCWTEYEGYYVFALKPNNLKNPKDSNKCYFYCILYIPNGGNEFWFFVPKT